MDAEGLLASAAINLGLALVALSLFSLLKKQPGNAPVYIPRRMAAGDWGDGLLPLGHGRLTPSLRWIGAAFRLSEDDVLRRHGLDALVVIRLFKFGCKLRYLSMVYPIQHIVECMALTITYSLKEEYKEITRRRIQHLKYHSKRPDQYTILVRGIPTCPDHGTYGCYVDHFFSKHYQTYQSYQIVHDIGNIEALQGIVQFEKIKRWFPPARAVQLIPGLNSVVTGYLPSMILNAFIYLVPFAMLGMASFEGCISNSQKEIKACNMVFYFLLGNVFFLSVLSGSLLDQIGESFTHPKNIPSHLASAVSAQSDFFITYILTNGMSGFSLEVLQFGLLTWQFLKAHSVGHSKEPYLYGFPYYRVVPIVSLAILIGMVYAVVAPLLLPILLIYFLLGYAVYINQMEDVYETTYDTCGKYWPNIHHYIFLSVTLMQITMIGLFGLKSKPGASFATVPLLVLNILYNEYSKVRFLPTFHHRPVQVAKENDELDETEQITEGSSDNAVSAYKPPWMRPTNLEFDSVQPLNL
ncbi:hypothetical protein PR202_gb03752 [Eleusine coracana subsp. coracana]|uniref:CSC1-like protein n=1 Tax=Eleusine coracana subsp. coracana TaxID=191504 RepID=A0AAV5E2I7_ELECO|nr:hypothetical protein PR202_gb03752 [Eleusine coracana subsp. coracana]